MTGQQPLRSSNHGGNGNSNRREVIQDGEEDKESQAQEEVREGTMMVTEDWDPLALPQRLIQEVHRGFSECRVSQSLHPHPRANVCRESFGPSYA